MQRSRFLNSALYAATCVVGIFIAFYPTLLSSFAYMQTDPGDTILVHYFLEHTYQMLTNQDYAARGIWSPAFFYPYEKVLAFSENMFGSAPLYWFFRSAFSSDIAFQLWMMGVCILNFVSFAALLQYLRIHPILVALGSFLFSFSMPRLAQLGHQQLLPQFFTPVAFLVLLKFIKNPNLKSLVLLLTLTYLQILSGIYLGWFFVFSFPVFLAVLSIIDLQARKRLLSFSRRFFKQLLTISIFWISLVLLTLLPYLSLPEELSSRSYADVDIYLPRLVSWLSAPPGSLWYPFLNPFSGNLPAPNESYLFPGFVVICIALLSLITFFRSKLTLNSERTVLFKACIITFLLIFCISLRLPNGFSLWRLIYELIPGASAIRGVSRIWLVAYLYLFVGLLVYFDSWTRRNFLSRKVTTLTLALVLVTAISEQITLNLASFEKSYFYQSVHEVRQLSKNRCDAIYMYRDRTRPNYVSQLIAMFAGIEANVPVVNGYSGFSPPNYISSTESMSFLEVINWLEINSKSNSGNLCVVSPTMQVNENSSITPYAFADDISNSNYYTSYVISLPIPKSFSQEIKVFSLPSNISISDTLEVPVIIKNTSNFIWSAVGDHPTNFSYRWIATDGTVVTFEGDGYRTPLPSSLYPGESIALNAVLRTPPQPGKYTLAFTMVQELISWFSDQTSTYPQFSVNVTSNPAR